MASQFVYWLTDKRASEYSEITDALAELYGVRFFSRCEDLIRQLTLIRPDTIIVSTRSSSDEAMSDINTICKNPEARGLKMILSLERDDPKTIHLAASLCFREILPLTLQASVWIKRFKFATASKPQKATVKIPPPGEIIEAVIRAPSRMTWIDKDRICVETSVFFDPGSKFTLLGPFSAFLGHRELPLTVLERQSKRLRYRHSSSIICKINIDELKDFRNDKLKTVARGQASSAPMNIYAIAKTQTGRLQIVNAFGQHNVLFATKMTTAAKEIEFFEPDALIIEESFLENKEVKSLIGLQLTCILTDPASANVLLLPANANVKSFKTVGEMHRYLQLKVPMSLRSKNSKWYIPEVSDFSRCSVQFQGTIENITKDFMIINTPNRARNFSLMEVATNVANAMNTSEFVKLCEHIPGPEGHIASSFLAMRLCSSNDIFGENVAQVRLLDINREAKARPNHQATPNNDKVVVQARPQNQIAPGHEFYAKEVYNDVKIAYKKPSAAKIILDSLDTKTVIQGLVLSLVGIGLVYLLITTIQSPNTRLNGFATWFSGHAVGTGK